MTPRARVVAEALAWERTPYVHAARVRGAGVDCANLLAAVYHAAGLVPDLDLGHYPRDWHLHRSEERFMGWLDRYGARLNDGEPALPGDVAAFRFGRCVSHGGIVLAWPVILHAWSKAGMVVRSDAASVGLTDRLAGVWRVQGL
jgi:cell wall-associated NlpC family hydrolase